MCLNFFENSICQSSNHSVLLSDVRTASIGGKQYTFSTLIEDDESDNSVATVMELDLTSALEDRDDDEGGKQDGGSENFPHKHRIMKQSSGGKERHEEVHERNINMNSGETSLSQSSNKQISKGKRYTRELSNYDDGSVIDVLCLYTRQALESRCKALKGKDCSDKYSNYINTMNDKCQFAVHQAVRSIWMCTRLNVQLQFLLFAFFC